MLAYVGAHLLALIGSERRSMDQHQLLLNRQNIEFSSRKPIIVQWRRNEVPPRFIITLSPFFFVSFNVSYRAEIPEFTLETLHLFSCRKLADFVANFEKVIDKVNKVN